MAHPVDDGITETQVVTLLIEDLALDDSPRLDGVRADHVQLLAELTDELPAIVVHTETMRVIDGAHRVHAAILRGQSEIGAILFDGTSEEAFLLAVKTNVTHGMPLTAGDRKAAAERIIRSHSDLSDRAIAGTTGLSARTIAGIRARTGGAATEARRGRDGRLRPLSAAEGRRKASDVLQERPESSLREIAREAGISVGTVRDVMARIRAGEDPVPDRDRRTAERHRGATETRPPAPVARPRRPHADDRLDVAALLAGLRRDPSLRYTEAGRALLRWLDVSTGSTTNWPNVLDAIPPHCAVLVGRIARECGNAWLELAVQLERRESGAQRPGERRSTGAA
jgi:ParB-like chromosome segregation protein Spo0J